MKLEHLKAGLNVSGVETDLIVTVVAASALGPNSIELVYRLPEGGLRSRLLQRHDEEQLGEAVSNRPWSFEADPALFKLVAETQRMRLAHLFDPMMAVHASTVEPLPHQITAVYESMLPRQPLRFVLADDPGAGKTIMAGLYMRELLLRADAQRILIVAPGSLAGQWQEEMAAKFGLDFKVFHRDQLIGGNNPFEQSNLLIARLDQLSRAEDLRHMLLQVDWDLVVFDEAHKLSAHFSGQDVKATGRFKLAQALGTKARHLLLMTATPHNGKEEEFQLFLSLLDGDRFYGKFRGSAAKIDPSDLMRRMVKEELLRFDGTRLFPERKAYTVNYELSAAEMELYERVTRYVREEMDKAEELDGRRRGAVGFALTALQRRLASSPEAIANSLRSRADRLESRLREARQAKQPSQALAVSMRLPDEDWEAFDDEDCSADEQEQLEENAITEATAAQTIGGLEAELQIVRMLQRLADALVASGQDRKWEQLSSILQHSPETRDESGRLRKLIVFTEHRATLNYLKRKIDALLGHPGAVVEIHGSTQHDERKRVQEEFRSNPEVRVLVATDAAGEGVNLQVANLMVNYDLPWNPNRLEQRFGRIHRIGQTQVCHLWNLVAHQTREGQVYNRLLQKLESIGAALSGRVFDVLGEVFEGTSLRALLIEAIRYGETQAGKMHEVIAEIDRSLSREHCTAILERSALATETMTLERLFKVKAEMDRAEARRLQPHFVAAYFLQAFRHLQGAIHAKESERWEIANVPLAIRQRDRRLTGGAAPGAAPIIPRYERICFAKHAVQLPSRPQAPQAVLMHPGHPLMLAMTDLMLERNGNVLRQGAILVDHTNASSEPYVLLMLSHEVLAGDQTLLSRRLQFVSVDAQNHSTPAGFAPHLDLAPLADADRPLLAPLLAQAWLSGNLEERAVSLAAELLVPEHAREVGERHTAQVDKTLHAVHERLMREINFWTHRLERYEDEQKAGRDMAIAIQKARREIQDLDARLNLRRHKLLASRNVSVQRPVALGAALVVPEAYLQLLRGDANSSPAQFAADAAARARIESLAMRAVCAAEQARGHDVRDVSADKCGWDVEAQPPMDGDRLPVTRLIEVKGRAVGADSITVTVNEIRACLNKPDQFWLAIVLVAEDDSVQGPWYVKRPFTREPEAFAGATQFDLAPLLAMAERG